MDPEMDHTRLISVDPGKKGPSRVPSWPKLGWKFTRTCRCTPISRVFWHIDVCVMFSRGQILLEIHDAIAMRTQTWVGKKCDAFTRVNCVQNSRCHCYDDTNLGGQKFTMLSRGVLGTYRYTLITSPPSARVAAMSAMQHITSSKHLWNTLETSLKLSRNTLETPLKYSWHTP